MKVAFWRGIPKHTRSHFYAALRGAGVDVQVRYFNKVKPGSGRAVLGWLTYESLPTGEQYILESMDALESVPDWRERIHVMQSHTNRFVHKLIGTFQDNRVPWVFWSEYSRAGIRRIGDYFTRRWHTRMVNEHALGAFGVGRKAMDDFLARGIRPEKVALLPTVVPACDRSAKPDAACEEFRRGRKAFLFSGRLCAQKGIEYLIPAFAHVAKLSPDWVLILLGTDDSNGNYSKRAAELGVGDRLLFRGCVKVTEVSSVFKSSAVLTLPTVGQEGWGVVVNEAASMGLAIIVSRRCGSGDHLVQPGVNGFHVEPRSVDSLAAAMAAYVRRPELTQEHGLASLRIFEDFTPERNAQRFVSVIQSWRALAGMPA